ncbi:hypothetical protein SAMN05216303_108249 [Rhodoferax sp. OV413]|uniref:hypothetical protein n=1 Tax=Rhodoferax sp. OV413 TaxID=1855285 RepID=UPI00088D6EB7|nr:hypothetical protein [Rhodoferax sp. OV413]SDP88301.1 hypothetical protein SAMN05216303_108249 [Rhodoferax sp. OV413]
MQIPATTLSWDASLASSTTLLRSTEPELDDPALASAVLSLSPAITTTPLTYEPPARSAVQEVQAWLSRSEDTVSKLMARNFSSSGNTSRLTGLGGALLERFASSATDFKQSVVNFVPKNNATAALTGLSQAALANVGSNASAEVSLSIRTRSGTVVSLVLTNQSAGLGVEINSSRPLSSAERQALTQLAGGFEKAVQSITADPPRMDIADLGAYDSAVLSSIALSAKVDRKGEKVLLEFRAEDGLRSLKLQTPTDQIDLKLDLGNPAMWGPAAQREQSIARYLGQIEQAGQRGQAKAEWIASVQDAFSALQHSYGSSTGSTSAATPLLTGLADFDLHIQTSAQASNPLRPDELDRFDYRTRQSTQTSGPADQPDSIRQLQTSALKAGFHSALTSAGPPQLTSEKNSQNYLYTQVDDQAHSEVALRFERDATTEANGQKSAHQSTHVQKYEFAVQVEERTTPKDFYVQQNLIEHLMDFQQQPSLDIADRAEKDRLRSSGTQAILLETDPARLAEQLR